MILNNLSERLGRFVEESAENSIQAEYAIHPQIVGIPYYDAPLLGCAAADDPIFTQLKNDPKAYGALLKLPEEWLTGAKSVISFFLPYSREVRDSNREDLNTISDVWLHARIEGQAFLIKTCLQLASFLEAEGYRTVIPAISKEFAVNRDPERAERGEPLFISNWSERHAAFAAGLGTFGLSKHIITEKGVCGRFGSIITDAAIDTTERNYVQPYEYCSFCGACAHRCPVNAISPERGKNNQVCSDFVDETGRRYAPRYGCGKCQLSVPCEFGIPKGK